MSEQKEVELPELSERAKNRIMHHCDYELAYSERCGSTRSALTQIAALTKRVEELTGERDRSREARRNHAETLRGIARMDPTTDGERMRQWARDGLSGYVATYEMTLREFEQRVEKAEAELANRDADISDKVSAWHEYLKSALGCSVTDPLRFDYYAQEVIKLKAELAALREGATVTYRVERAGSVGPNHIRETLEDARQARGLFSQRSGHVWHIVEVTTITRERILDEKGENESSNVTGT